MSMLCRVFGRKWGWDEGEPSGSDVARVEEGAGEEMELDAVV